MILNSDVATALEQRLFAAPSLGVIAWENYDAVLVPPYIMVEHIPATAEDMTLAGGGEVLTGYLSIAAITAQGEHATAGRLMAESIKARFPYGLRLAITGGEVLITKPPLIMRGYPDGADWRTMVRVDYRAS